MKTPIDHIFYICGRGDWDNSAPKGFYYDLSEFFIWKNHYARFVKTMNGSRGGYN